MHTISDELSTTLTDWTVPVAILGVTWAAVRVTRLLLAHLKIKTRYSFIHALALSISRLIYLIGLRAFVDSAPLGPKLTLWLDSGIYILGVLIVLNLLQRAALLAIEWSALKSHPSDMLQQGFFPLIRNLVTLFVFAMGGIMILKHFNYDVLSLLTALGVGSLAIGLAAKDTLSNMISGFTLVIDRNLKAGDRINLAGQVGQVEEIGLRSTRIAIGNGSTLIVPNSELVNTKLLNLSMPSTAQSCSVNLRVPLQVTFESFRAICKEVLSEVAPRDESKPVSVLLSSVIEGFQLVNISFWIEDSALEGAVVSDFHEKLLSRLRSEDISLLPPAPPTPVIQLQQKERA